MAKQRNRMKCLLTIFLLTTSITYGQIPNNKTSKEDSAYKHKYVYPHNWDMRDTIFTNPTDTIICMGQSTIGIITSKKGQDTVKVYAIIKNKTTKKQYKAFIYSVRQVYKWSEHNTPDSEPQYFFKHIEYLGQDKKPLQKSITVIKATELK